LRLTCGAVSSQSDHGLQRRLLQTLPRCGPGGTCRMGEEQPYPVRTGRRGARRGAPTLGLLPGSTRLRSPPNTRATGRVDRHVRVLLSHPRLCESTIRRHHAVRRGPVTQPQVKLPSTGLPFQQARFGERLVQRRLGVIDDGIFQIVQHPIIIIISVREKKKWDQNRSEPNANVLGSMQDAGCGCACGGQWTRRTTHGKRHTANDGQALGWIKGRDNVHLPAEQFDYHWAHRLHGPRVAEQHPSAR
jgi:hypothetical protein